MITAVFPDLKTGFEDIADADVKLRRALGEMRGSFLLRDKDLDTTIFSTKDLYTI